MEKNGDIHNICTSRMLEQAVHFKRKWHTYWNPAFLLLIMPSFFLEVIFSKYRKIAHSLFFAWWDGPLDGINVAWTYYKGPCFYTPVPVYVSSANTWIWHHSLGIQETFMEEVIDALFRKWLYSNRFLLIRSVRQYKCKTALNIRRLWNVNSGIRGVS